MIPGQRRCSYLYSHQGIDILREASNHDAAYDSSARDPPPQCFPGTREQYIEDIVHWAVPAIGANDPLSLFWMKGPAGVGKSAVAQTCVERLKEMGKLGAAFFFATKKRDKATQFFPTIIYQLSTEFPDYCDLVDQRIRRDRTIFSKTMAAQFKTLIVKPLQELEESGRSIGKRIAIFIDGLDECESADSQCDIIKIIAAAARDGTTPLCWAFFSRPESHIEGTFAIADIVQITCTTLLPISRDADGDIELYLRGGFENILRRRNIPLKTQWPSDDDIRILVGAAHGLFIYVATALRVIIQSGTLPEDSLRAIITHISDCDNDPRTKGAPAYPFAELDAFYTLIMQRISPEILPTVLLLYRMLGTWNSYPGGGRTRGVLFLSNVLGLSELKLKLICNELSAVLQVHISDQPFLIHTADTSKPFQHASFEIVEALGYPINIWLGGSLSFYHKSFYDFLVDSTRSGVFCITDLAGYNDTWFKHCLETQLKYQESYCFRDSELVLAPGVLDSSSSLSYPYANELVNSILKARVLDFLHKSCLSLTSIPEISPQLLQQFQHADFRKCLYINTIMFKTNRPMNTIMWGYPGHTKFISGTGLFQHYSHDLSGFAHQFRQVS
ncbi:hypothetical protein P691DRAFT_808516 [Macrolepiota fuliginosa MF-IS2]|uniref:Nephrocystin 3-like N-terminal domain-containing protein n=1 Tax=Macrolepiota fuliginosa MF-IS2 TaxID=1400762 RepID=A0A9P5XPJ5_9AGAR|nr:hypothetical protein P691DRAFT_808516 [Macrolepiota fuliginosa MF-IS2]